MDDHHDYLHCSLTISQFELQLTLTPFSLLLQAFQLNQPSSDFYYYELNDDRVIQDLTSNFCMKKLELYKILKNSNFKKHDIVYTISAEGNLYYQCRIYFPIQKTIIFNIKMLRNNEINEVGKARANLAILNKKILQLEKKLENRLEKEREVENEEEEEEEGREEGRGEDEEEVEGQSLFKKPQGVQKSKENEKLVTQKKNGRDQAYSGRTKVEGRVPGGFSPNFNSRFFDFSEHERKVRRNGEESGFLKTAWGDRFIKKVGIQSFLIRIEEEGRGVGGWRGVIGVGGIEFLGENVGRRKGAYQMGGGVIWFDESEFEISNEICKGDVIKVKVDGERREVVWEKEGRRVSRVKMGRECADYYVIIGMRNEGEAVTFL